MDYKELIKDMDRLDEIHGEIIKLADEAMEIKARNPSRIYRFEDYVIPVWDNSGSVLSSG